MLFVLTGDIQSGKTRWLESIVQNLKRNGITPYGVIAPGVWADRRDNPNAYPHADANGFEKLGIDNVLLPDNERIAFGRRADLAREDGSYDPQSQSGKAKLGWSINDEAIARVNGHFSSIRKMAKRCDERDTKLLVVDELGQLELIRGDGLVQAVRALEDGPTDAMPHALIVVREALLPHLEGRFEKWGKRIEITPDEQSLQQVLGSFR